MRQRNYFLDLLAASIPGDGAVPRPRSAPRGESGIGRVNGLRRILRAGVLHRPAQYSPSASRLTYVRTITGRQLRWTKELGR